MNGNGQATHAMNHEHPANMPSILHRVTGVDAVKMVGVEGVFCRFVGGLVVLGNVRIVSATTSATTSTSTVG